MPDESLIALSHELRLACMRISRRVRFDSGGGLAPHQFSVLARLDEGRRTPGQLAECERVSPPSMTRTVKSLLAAGLVTREADPDDGRQVFVVLTAAGRDVLADTRHARDAWMMARLEELSEADLVVLTEATGILTKVAGR